MKQEISFVSVYKMLLQFSKHYIQYIRADYNFSIVILGGNLHRKAYVQQQKKKSIQQGKQ